MPAMPQMARGFGASGGQSKQVTLGSAPHEAFASAAHAIGANGGEILWQQPPQGAKFLLTRKSFWSTAGVALKYDGDLQVMPGAPGQSTVRIALKVQWNSTVPLLLMQGAAVLVAAMFNYYFAAFALLFLIGSLAITAWNASNGVPEKALNDIVRALQAGAVAPAPPTPSYAPPPPQAPQAASPAPTPAPAPASAPPAPAAATAALTDQIMQLAALRDAGAITVDEFEAKKRDLLSRI